MYVLIWLALAWISMQSAQFLSSTHSNDFSFNNIVIIFIASPSCDYIRIYKCVHLNGLVELKSGTNTFLMLKYTTWDVNKRFLNNFFFQFFFVSFVQIYIFYMHKIASSYYTHSTVGNASRMYRLAMSKWLWWLLCVYVYVNIYFSSHSEWCICAVFTKKVRKTVLNVNQFEFQVFLYGWKHEKKPF